MSDQKSRKELMWRADLSGSSSTSPKKSKKKDGKLPKEIQKIKDQVTCTIDSPLHTQTYSSATAFSSCGFDNSFDFDEFKKNFRIDIQHKDEDEMVFDLVGIDTPIANAIRRILLSEVPAMAFEQIYIRNNTSVLVDEVLSHRIGLLPIQADPRFFHFRGSEPQTDANTIEFELNVSCPRGQKEKNIYSGDLVWHPLGSQEEDFESTPIKMVHDDILLAVLGPGQEIHLTARAEKGVGADHVKFSPVCTAFYRILPEITLNTKVQGEKAEELVAKCPMKVFDIEDIGGTKNAVVARPRNCTVCRECIREPEWQPKIDISRNKQHFIFTIESTGALAPELIFHMALKLFTERLAVIKQGFLDL